MAARIHLNNIYYHYPASRRILNGIDLSLDPGEYTAIFGANGSGKSTLGYLFNGLIPHFFDGTLEGTVLIDGIDTKNASVSELFSHVGLVIQNPDAQLFNSTVENDIAFGLESLGLSAGEILQRISTISTALDIENLLDRSPATLSGGEKRLVSIAAVLCLDPALLLLDEPYSNLDWKGVQRVSRLLREVHRSGKNVVVIEQKIDRFLKDSTRCIILERGALRYDGASDNAREVLEKEHLVPHYPERNGPDPAQGNESILKVSNLFYRVDGRDILHDVSIDLRRGQTVAIVGENGAGKTTLIKHFNGLLKPAAGEVIIQGENIRGLTPADLAARVGICFQNPNDQFFKENVREEILVGPRMIGKKENSDFDEVCNVLDLHGLLDQSPYRLSEGEKKRVAVASILAMRPDILVLDEPTVGQDGRFRESMANLLGAFARLGMTNIIVTHDLDFAQATADRWIVLHDGRIVADGPPQDIRHDDKLIQMGALGGAEKRS